MTNGEKLQKIIPNLEYEILSHTVITNIDNGAWFSLEWWNAEYQEPSDSEKPNKSEIPTGSTTKNNLAVDCISRADALDCVNWGYSFSDIYKKINELPSVTPQEPILNKIRTEIESLKRLEIRGEKTPLVNVDKVLDIIDKYKAEVEPQESEGRG
jgi:hypothetical protein